MWHDISDDVQIKVGHIIYEDIIIGAIKDGMIGVLKEGFRVRLEREYDDDGFVNRFFIEKDTAGDNLEMLFQLAKKKPGPHRPLVEIRNMQLLELNIGNKQIFFNVDHIESFQQKSGNISILKMRSGMEYTVDYNVQRIKQKIVEATNKP